MAEEKRLFQGSEIFCTDDVVDWPRVDDLTLEVTGRLGGNVVDLPSVDGCDLVAAGRVADEGLVAVDLAAAGRGADGGLVAA